MPYQTATNTTGFLAASTDGYILSLVSGVPAWIPNTVGTVTAVTASAPLASSGGSTPNITITQASGSSDGYLSSANWTTFNNKANSGANSDITSMTGITGGISTPDYIAFDTTYATALTAGQLGWDSTNNSLSYGMFGGNIVQHIGEDQYLYIKASATITKGQVIMFTGSVGASGVLTGAPATGITDGTYIMGVAAEAIANNAFGFVQTFGVLTNVNTASFSDGNILWYDPTVTGGLTATKPSAPNVKVQVAACNKGGSAGGGVITVRINPGSELGGTDSNVQLSSPTGGQILSYNQTGQYWSNINLTAGTGISITPTTGGAITIANTVTGGLTITDDTTTNATRYLAFTSATSGSITGQNVSSTKLQFNPSTGTLTATGFSGSGASLTSLSASNISSGTLAVANGGTGQTTYTNGQLLIGNTTGNTLTKATLTAGDGISITNGTGSITVTNTSAPYSASYVVIAGGAAGGGNAGGGGGAGGYLSGTVSLLPSQIYSFVVGGGGTGTTTTIGGSGTSSTAFGLTAIGGGGGGQNNTSGGAGASGGSGGGSAQGAAGGSGTSGQGNNGGGSAAYPGAGGGGGGASAAGSSNSGSNGGAGGAGTASSITGSSVTRAGGGGGYGENRTGGTGGAGGAGGGGAGAASNGGGGGNGTANTGSGGGGGGIYSGKGGNGGSGVVIISVPTAKYTGTTTGSPTVTTSGSNTIMTFTASGSYTA